MLLMSSLASLLSDATRALFVTGKGGVGKTSLACALAVGLADRGRRTLLVSTDPASNLDEVLGVALSSAPTAVPGAPGLFASNLDPIESARAYRERILGPVRGLLPAGTLSSIEEQLSGACTVEIAAFDEFSRLLADPAVTSGFDHVVFDTAPTGHTLRLLALPAAWTDFLAASVGGTSCLGPLAGLAAQRSLYEATRHALADPAVTTLVLVARPDRTALAEAERARAELAPLGLHPRVLVVNAVFQAADPADPVALALEARGRSALDGLPDGLRAMDRVEVPLLPTQVLGVDAARGLLVAAEAARAAGPAASARAPRPQALPSSRLAPPLEALVEEIASTGHGVVFTMGKGGVGKTSVARWIAEGLARRGAPVHLTTTDPAGRVATSAAASLPTLRTSRIDPKAETSAYAAEVLASQPDLDAAGRALLEEDLRSPCTEEIAVFRALARVVADGVDGFVVIDTAPTGHTILLLDAAGSYHREVTRTTGTVPDAVRALLPRLRDPGFTRVILVTWPEATPVHEASALQDDLRRAGIEPFAWVVNACLTPLAVRDPVLVRRKTGEARLLDEVRARSRRMFVVPWMADAQTGVSDAATTTTTTTTASSPANRSGM